MWFRKSASVAVVEAPKASVVAPSRISMEPRMADEERRVYIEKAKALGVINGALKEEMLLNFLKESGLGFFSYEKVEAYLDNMFGKARHRYSPTWGWRPLRPEDQGKLSRDRADVDRNPNNGFLGGTYQKAVPMPVLLTVQRVFEAVPDVYFYVSDQVVVNGQTDPFLSVSAVGMTMYVIERWDEPSFRG